MIDENYGEVSVKDMLEKKRKLTTPNDLNGKI